MTPPTPSRRDFVGATGAFALGWLGADPAAVRSALRAAWEATQGESVRYDVLTPEQAADLDAIAGHIVPTDDLPGAREARVVVFIDRALASFQAGQKGDILDGLADLNRRSAGRRGGARFAHLLPTEQVALLREIEETPFFGQVRSAVLVGMFAHPQWGGNYDGAGWQVLGFEPRYIWQPPFGAYDAEEMGR